MRKLLPLAIVILALGITVALVVGCGALGPIGGAAEENANEKTCRANMKTVQTQSNVYASSNDGTYPGSLDNLKGYLENTNVTCPSRGTITWHFHPGAGGSPPNPSCSRHGEPY